MRVDAKLPAASCQPGSLSLGGKPLPGDPGSCVCLERRDLVGWQVPPASRDPRRVGNVTSYVRGPHEQH